MAAQKKPSPFMELGASGLRNFAGYVREEFLKQLTGWRGQRMFREMRDNDPVIGAMFFAVERLLMGVDFTVAPASEDPKDQEVADFIKSALGDTEQSWPELISEILTFLQYGYSVHEICYKRRRGATNNPNTKSKYDDGLVGWRKFASRAQETLLHWNFNDSGDPIAMVQLLPTGGPLLSVPLLKCLHFKTRLLKNNPEGVSLIRNCYVPYFRKKRIEEIEAIGVERDLAGMPIVWVPPRILAADASPADKAQYETMKRVARDTCRNEQEGFVFPLAYDKETKQKMYDITLLSTGGKRQIDTTAIVDRYDHRMLATWLADFIVLGQGGSAGRGSFAQAKNKTDMFALAAESFLDLIANEFNTKAIPDLLSLNNMEGACVLRHGDISEQDILDFSNAIAVLAQAMVITPDDELENVVREKVGLPPRTGQSPADNLNTGDAARAGGDTDPPSGSEAPEAQGQTDDSSDPLGPPGTRLRKAVRKARSRFAGLFKSSRWFTKQWR